MKYRFNKEKLYANIGRAVVFIGLHISSVMLTVWAFTQATTLR